MSGVSFRSSYVVVLMASSDARGILGKGVSGSHQKCAYGLKLSNKDYI